MFLCVSCNSMGRGRTAVQKRRHQHDTDSGCTQIALLPGFAASVSRHSMPTDPSDADRYKVFYSSILSLDCVCMCQGGHKPVTVTVAVVIAVDSTGGLVA